MVGGVAVAAGTGVLTAPFVGDDEGRPASTVSAPALPERPFLSPSPENGGQGGPTPDDDAETPAGPGATEEMEPGGRATEPGGTAEDGGDRSGHWWKAVTSYCRDLRDGKQLSHDRRHALERAAGGSDRVRQYCLNVLKAPGGGTWDKPGRDKSKKNTSKDKDRDRDRARDRGKGTDREKGDEGGDRRVDAAAVASSAMADLPSDRVLTPLTRR